MTGAPAKAIFTGASGNRLIADVFGESGPSVLLLHGGGQTRHAWGKTAERLARRPATWSPATATKTFRRQSSSFSGEAGGSPGGTIRK